MRTNKGLEVPMEGECFECGEICTPSQFCQDCEEFFCDECNIYSAEDLSIDHEPEDHLYIADDDLYYDNDYAEDAEEDD